MDQRVQKVIVLMQGNFNRELSLSKMARFVNLSPSRLSHLFKSEIGIAPAQYLKTLRMRKAQELLETTFLTIKEIAINVGMDESHFVQDFKRAYGLTPAQYRIATLLLTSSNDN